jgi:two-component system sensor histidine kinase DesK
LCLLLATRLTFVLGKGADSQVPFTVALFVLPLLYTVPRTRALLSRHRWVVLTVQAVLTWVPFLVFGGAWQFGIGGLLAGLVLLMVPGRASWLLAGVLLAAEVMVRAALTGLPESPAWYAVVVVAGYYVDDALTFFGLVRLAQIVREVTQARGRAAGLAVAGERLAAARSLQTAVGERLASIAATAAAARRALGGDAARARTLITAAGSTARDAVAQAREVAAGHREAFGLEGTARPARSAVIGARLAWAVVVAELSMYAAIGIGSIVAFRYSAHLTALAVGCVVVATTVQLYHSGAARRNRTPRAWPVTLAVQAGLAYAFLLPFVHVYAGDLGPLVAGSMLLLVPGRWGWAGYAAVVGSYAVLFARVLPAAYGGSSLVPNTLNQAVFTAGGGLLVYGLARLAALALQLEKLNLEFARMAVVRERLRIARDVHDLLGLGLSAIALKADLIGRLIGRDDAQAETEISHLSRICGSSRAEIRLVTGDGTRLSLASELAAARQILDSAGVQVQADIPGGPLPPEAEDVLATVLREAVTNVLRHSSATACTIEACASAGTVRLRVTNDGVSGQLADRSGSGLANLTARVQVAGGSLTSRQADGMFYLLAEIPAATPSA